MEPLPPAHDGAPAAARRETLHAVLDLLVPASPDGRMPAAGALPEVVSHVEQLSGELPALGDALDRLQREAMARHGASFAALDHAARSALLGELATRDAVLLQRLGLETLTCYYQQDRVIEALGMEARPPFPTGYQVIAGDLTLLKPVIARGRIYRDAP